MTSSPNHHGSGRSAERGAIVPNRHDNPSPGQLSLLPEYTEGNGAGLSSPDKRHNGKHNGKHNNGSAPQDSSRSHKWLTLLGIVLLAIAGFGAWRWWQGRSAGERSQSGPQATPVEIAPADTATIEETSTFTGRLAAEQSSDIQAEQPGRVAQILVEQGQAVTTGTPLIRLSAEQEQADVAAALARIDIARAAEERATSELLALQAERDRLQAEVALQAEQFDRISLLVEEGALPREELDLQERNLAVERANRNALDRRIRAAQNRIQEAQATLRERQANLERIRETFQDTTITAPFAGTIGDIPIETGDYVQSGQTLTQLVANENLDLNISIPQERAADLEIGLPVELVNGSGETLQAGNITFISPQVEADSQFIPTEATFPNTNGQLRDGQFVRSEVIWERRPNQIVVPQAAVVYQGEDRFVYVPQMQDDQMVAMRQPIELGLEQGTEVEVVAGLEPGQRIIVAGIQRLGDGVPIRTTRQSADTQQSVDP